MDQIRIDNLEIYAYHGVFDDERRDGQNFYVNAVLFVETERAGESDDLNDSTDYGAVCKFIDRFMKENTFQLIEAVAHQMAEALLLAFPLVRELDLEIRKPSAPILLPFESVSVKIHRGWHRVYIAVGSNMGDKEGYIQKAIDDLKADVRIDFLRSSQMIVTKPYGGVEQDDFLNGVFEVDTLLSPQLLLEKLHKIESSANRERIIHWGPRTLDLDILLYDDLIFNSSELVIPHPDMKNREFVLAPLCELAPYLIHPVLERPICALLECLQKKN